MQQKRQSLDPVQLARAFAMIAVLLVHSSSTGATSLTPDSILLPIYTFFGSAGKLGTPTFIMLSAFVLFYNYYPRPLDRQLIARFYSKRLLYILLPYVVFSTFYFVLNNRLFSTSLIDQMLVNDYVNDLLYGKAHPHLYFVFISVQLYLLFPFIMLAIKKYSYLRKNAWWIGIILQWIWVIANKNYFQIEMKGSISLSYFSYYFVGAYLGIYYEDILRQFKDDKKRQTYVTSLLTAVFAFMALYVGYMYMISLGLEGEIIEAVPSIVYSYLYEFSWANYTLLAGLTLFLLAHWLNNKFTIKTKRFFMELGATSFGIYLIHPALLLVMRTYLPDTTPLIFNIWQVITFLVVGFGSWIIVRVIYFITPYYWVLFGKMSGPKYNKR
ncbi:acyltransferase [Mangrovibacillus cuniculi]|uniref:Acyltransferase n=1 Tax=Mangrovibacillus cuniculi TaxID=2593652 RepID=A0A7S8CCM9_9BACI|nr:acyltransferase [Mangrovibacillus cuniculi]QPC47535.1 acyltransferase [Mangrovibacillus cuniculi]